MSVAEFGHASLTDELGGKLLFTRANTDPASSALVSAGRCEVDNRGRRRSAAEGDLDFAKAHPPRLAKQRVADNRVACWLTGNGTNLACNHADLESTERLLWYETLNPGWRSARE